VLDYILSKTVMLLFLVLTVAAFVMVKDSLADYFIQQSAVQFARSSVMRVAAIVGDPTAMSYKEVIPLAPGISGGGKQMAYEVNVLCKRVDKSKVLLGFAILSPLGKLVAFSSAELSNPYGGTLSFETCYLTYGNMHVTAASTKQHYLIVRKDGSGSGDVIVSIIPSTDGLTNGCTVKKVC
jgi:hypothetical protein